MEDGRGVLARQTRSQEDSRSQDWTKLTLDLLEVEGKIGDLQDQKDAQGSIVLPHVAQ
jgi:hypothetical protein